MLLFFKKKKQTKTPVDISIKNLYDMIYSSWDIDQNGLKLVVLGHLGPYIPPLPKYEVWQIEIAFFLSFWVIFTPPPLMTWKIKILKKWKIKKHLFYRCVP